MSLATGVDTRIPFAVSHDHGTTWAATHSTGITSASLGAKMFRTNIKDVPKVEGLKRDEVGLIEEYKSRGGRDVNAALEPGSGSSLAHHDFDADSVLREVMPDLRDDPAVSVARAQLAMATSRYQDILMRIANDARSVLDRNSSQLEGRYFFAETASQVGPAFQGIQNQILRLSR